MIAIYRRRMLFAHEPFPVRFVILTEVKNPVGCVRSGNFRSLDSSLRSE